MGFKFTYLCDLLSSLEKNRIVKASTASRADKPDIQTISRWFAQHEKRLRHKDTDQLAVLSCLFPEKLPERVYWLQHAGLARVIGRCLLLGLSRREELDRWRVSGGSDLSECVENVMRQAENHIPDGQEVCVEEVDSVLVRLASRCKFSDPRIRRQHNAVDVEECLGPLYRRMNSRDAKWLTRMILKNYSPVILPATFVLRKFHFLLPPLLLFQDSFDSALRALASERISRFPPHPEPGLAEDLGVIALECLDPITGVKIGRPDYYKARSIKHCCHMVDKRRMSIERKYDGEYCQIHIDLSKGLNCIKIFSKSGKDSTLDRAGIHQVLWQSLRIGSPKCRFSKRCILEGELLVWSDKHERILDFHKLRKFISRSGTFIGTETDSLPQPYENLMIVFFDILALDDNVCLKRPHRERRLLLKDVVQRIDGRADIAEQYILDFSHSDSEYRLERLFAKAIAQRWEGCVLKGCDDPYFSIFANKALGTFGRWIKLKKDYIPGLGDTVDLALVGAKYEPRDAAELKRIPKILWTQFFIGCLVNKDAVLKLGATPCFRVIDVIGHHCMNPRNMLILNQSGEFTACNPESGHGFKIEYGKQTFPAMDVTFKTPFVVEMLGSGFEKASGTRYFALRFPRITKIYWDRSFEEAATFQELQDLADKARAVTAVDDTAEQEIWTKRLKLSNGAAQYTAQNASFASTASASDSDEEDYNALQVLGSQRQNLPSVKRMDMGESNKALARVPADPVPIHVDSSSTPSSSRESDLPDNVFTENANQSSPQESVLRNNSSTAIKSVSARVDKELEDVNRSSAYGRTTQHCPVLHPPGITTNSSHSINHGHPTVAPNGKMPQLRPKSPLPTLPQHFIQTSLPDGTNSLNNFIQILTSNASLHDSNPHATSQNQSLGLIFTNPDTLNSPLGPTTLTIINALSQYLKEEQRSRPQAGNGSGKIFILNVSVLQLGTGANDTRFCLRSTWENIARCYFYACISWSWTAIASAATGKQDPCACEHIPVDEIPSTITPNPMPTPTPASASGPGTMSKVMPAKAPSIRISFDEEEVTCLRQVCFA